MDEAWWPLNGPATYGEDIPLFSHMDWYISSLKENRPHDLSHSGLQHDWSQIIDDIGEISDLLVHPEFDGVDLRELVAERENIDPSRVIMTAQALIVAEEYVAKICALWVHLVSFHSKAMT